MVHVSEPTEFESVKIASLCHIYDATVDFVRSANHQLLEEVRDGIDSRGSVMDANDAATCINIAADCLVDSGANMRHAAMEFVDATWPALDALKRVCHLACPCCEGEEQQILAKWYARACQVKGDYAYTWAMQMGVIVNSWFD